MDETEQSRGAYFRYRIRRDTNGALTWFRENWRAKRWFRWGSVLVALALAVWIVGWAVITHDLPDANKLLTYEPPLPTMVRGYDGEIVDSYARERRVELQFQDFPTQLINAFTSAEDKTFWTHGGIDIGGLIGAVFDYVSKLGTGERAKGGSTITQQVAKNILVGNAYSITRKLKEMILARRIEGVLTKPEIITLYLNEIPLGRRSFGVQAAARAYFDKDVDQLDLSQVAFLAILPKAPEHYSRPQYHDDAVARRNWVLDEMVRNGHISRAQAEVAKAKPLGLVTEHDDTRTADAGYFLEEVRRELLAKYGENAEDGPDSVYAGGLWVRTSLDTKMQDAARDSLRAGLMRYASGRPWHRIAWIDPAKGDLEKQLASATLNVHYQDWRVGVVTDRSGSTARIGFANGQEAPLTNLPDALKVGDVTAASPAGNAWTVRSVPEVSGGFLSMDPHNGRILAMQGGFDFHLSDFNRATQALRQPGSTIKPFVYATALEAGMTPATMVPDTPYCVYQGAALGNKCFRNFANEGGGGEHTMRWGLEQSRNLMTVHIAADVGMENVTRTFSKFGIGDYQNYLSFSLGAGDTTVERMVDAYAALFDHGMQHSPTVIDYVQDRHGKVIWRSDHRECTGCNMPQWDGKPMPRLSDNGKQVIDPRTAYQVVHMMEGVVKRGTAVRVGRAFDLPLAGKTGTTSGPTNVWFIGGSPDIIAGVYVGFDQPRNLGGYYQGANLAAPIFIDFVKATRDRWGDKPFLAPPGIRMVRIDRRSGVRVYDQNPTDDPLSPVIWEAFKPDTEPRRAQRQDQIDAMRNMILAELRRREAGPANGAANGQQAPPEDFVEEQGGLY